MSVEETMKIILLIVLAIAAIDDLIHQSIDILYVGAFFFGACCLQIFTTPEERISALLGVLLGVAIYVISYIGGGVIGSGDAYVLGMVGCYLGIATTTQVFVRAVMLAGVFGVVVLVKDSFFKGTPKNELQIPFVPFILTAYLSLLLGGAS